MLSGLSSVASVDQLHHDAMNYMNEEDVMIRSQLFGANLISIEVRGIGENCKFFFILTNCR